MINYILKYLIINLSFIQMINYLNLILTDNLVWQKAYFFKLLPFLK